MTIRRVAFYALTAALAACGVALPSNSKSRPAPTYPPLAYDGGADTLVISVDNRAFGGAPYPHEWCYHIDPMRVWGDGRVVVSKYEAGRRQVLAGRLTHDTIVDLLTFRMIRFSLEHR